MPRPSGIALGFGGLGVANAVLPLHSNVGAALVVTKWPATALVIALTMTLWAAGLCVHGLAARMVKARPATPSGP